MQIAELQHIPLERAFLCLDCASIGNSSAWCPACASQNIHSLAQVLDRHYHERAEAEGSRPSEQPHH